MLNITCAICLKNVWAKMYSSWYEIIVDHEADAVTQEDREFDGKVGGGVSCYVSIQVFVIFVYNCIYCQAIPEQTILDAIGMEVCGLKCISHDMKWL